LHLLKPRILLVLLLALAIAAHLGAQSKKKKKKDEEEITQTLPVVKDPPQAVSAEPGKLVFRVSPLSAKGLLTQQVHDALKALFQENHGASMVKLRAFVAGSGDLRRIQQLVSEVFTDRKMNLPALSTIQVGALPMEGAQVVIESIAEEKRTVNPDGLAFLSGQQTNDVRQSIAQLKTAVEAAAVKSNDVLRATCFLSSLDDLSAARTALSAAFPDAALNYVQLQRDAAAPLDECEAVGRLSSRPASTVTLVNPPQLTANPNYSQIALVNAPKIVITGTQMAFGQQESDIKLAYERLGKALDTVGASYKDVFWMSTYPVTTAAVDRVRAIRFQFLDHARPPASTLLVFEGLPSLDAQVAFDAIAVQR
jgi:enamine deaminase RidA (YjgF/YER057c/UK114 family)